MLKVLIVETQILQKPVKNKNLDTSLLTFWGLSYQIPWVTKHNFFKPK